MNQQQQLNELNFENEEKITKADKKLVDISWLNLDFFPLSTFKPCKNIQHIYLEGNKVEKLDDDFFLAFRQLKWLDIRNNILLEIPKTVAKHPCLEVLLLEGNKIKQLPIELGSVPNLRGLQLARNPLSYPTKVILERGSTAVIQFLQKEWQEHEVDSEGSSLCDAMNSLQRKSLRETVSPKKLSSMEKCNKLNSHKLPLRKPSHDLKDCVQVTKLVHPKTRTTMTIFKDWVVEANENQPLPLAELMEQTDTGAKAPLLPAVKHGKKHSGKKTKLEDTGLLVKSKLIKDTWLRKIRKALEEQQLELQRRRSKSALCEWQHNAKDLQIKKWTEYLQGEAPQLPLLEMPYGIDEEFNKIPSRSDLQKLEKPSNAKRRVSKSTESNSESLASKIRAVLDILQELRKARNDRAMTPRTEKRNLSSEMKKINELQRTLASLKAINFNNSL